MTSCFSIRSIILWLIVVCSAISNNLIVESFVVSRPNVESAFSKLPAELYGLQYSILAFEHPNNFAVQANSSGSSKEVNPAFRESFSQKVHLSAVEPKNLLCVEPSCSSRMPISKFAIGPLKKCSLKTFIHSIEMRLLLSSPTLGRRLESNHIGSKLPTDSDESKERQKKELDQLIERQAPDEPNEPNEPSEPSEPNEPNEPSERKPREPREPEPEYCEPELHESREPEPIILAPVEPSFSRGPDMLLNQTSATTIDNAVEPSSSNRCQANVETKKYDREKELNRGGKVGAITVYGYFNDETTISSPATCTRPSKSNKVESTSVKRNTLSQIPH